MLFDFQPPIVKNGETMSEKQMRDYLYKLVDKLTLVLNNIDDENMRSGKTVDMTSVNNSIASLRSRLENISANVESMDISALQSAVNALETAVAGKASSADLSTLQSTVDALETAVAGKASSASLSALQSTVDALETAVGSKASSADLSALQSTVNTLETAVGSKASSADLSALSDRMTSAEGTISSMQTDLSGKADASALANKQDKLISGTNVKTINGQSILGSGNIPISGGGSSYDDTELRRRVTAAEAEIDALQLLVTESHFSSTISAKATAATEYALTFNNTYSAIPVISALVYASSPTRYFGLVSLIITNFKKDANGNYTGANFKICNNHTAALSVRIRSTIIGLKKE